jgi:hypothetical protein
MPSSPADDDAHHRIDRGEEQQALREEPGCW